MPVLDLYYLPPSAPCRAVMLGARVIGIPLNLKTLNIMAGEHLTPEFLKLNPQHCIPTMDDNGFVLWESRAILEYMADQYASDETIYPKDPKKRALVNQRMYFDLGTLYGRLVDYFVPVLFRGIAPDAAKLAKLEEALDFLDTFLEGEEWVAGENMTIADIAIIASVSTIDAFGIVDLGKYSNVLMWYSRTKSSLAGYEELNQAGANTLGEMFKAKASQIGGTPDADQE